MATSYPTNPMHLLGRTIDFVQLFHEDSGPSPVFFTGRVVAVQVPAPFSDIEWSLLIEQRLANGRLVSDYSSLDDLYFEWPAVPQPHPSFAQKHPPTQRPNGAR
jgi:hypothetical protein